MRTLIRTAFAVMMLVACFTPHAQAQKLEKQLVARWDFSAMELSLADRENAPAEIVQQFDAMQGEMAETNEKLKGKAFFHFKKDGTMTMYDEEAGEKPATWKISGNQIFMKKDNGSDEQAFDIAIKNDILTLTMHNPEVPNLGITFKMKKKK